MDTPEGSEPTPSPDQITIPNFGEFSDVDEDTRDWAAQKLSSEADLNKAWVYEHLTALKRAHGDLRPFGIWIVDQIGGNNDGNPLVELMVRASLVTLDDYVSKNNWKM